MPKIDKIEFEKRIRIVQEWIIEDWQSVDIIAQIIDKWGLAQRQAKRYISHARKKWAAEDQEHIDARRKRKILKLQKLARSLKDPYKGTPAGLRSIIIVEKEIIKLEGMHPFIEASLKVKSPFNPGKDTFINFLMQSS
jgi:hypothetical protein